MDSLSPSTSPLSHKPDSFRSTAESILVLWNRKRLACETWSRAQTLLRTRRGIGHDFCSKLHDGGAPIGLLHASDVTYGKARCLKRYAGD